MLGRAGEEGIDRDWDGWMAPSNQRTLVWANSRRQWKTEKPSVLQFMGSQRVSHDWATNNKSRHQGAEEVSRSSPSGLMGHDSGAQWHCSYQRQAGETSKQEGVWCPDRTQSRRTHNLRSVPPKLTFKLGVPLGRELGREFQISITGFYTRITQLKHTENYLSCLLTGKLVVQSQKLNCIYRNIVSLQTWICSLDWNTYLISMLLRATNLTDVLSCPGIGSVYL